MKTIKSPCINLTPMLFILSFATQYNNGVIRENPEILGIMCDKAVFDAGETTHIIRLMIKLYGNKTERSKIRSVLSS